MDLSGSEEFVFSLSLFSLDSRFLLTSCFPFVINHTSRRRAHPTLYCIESRISTREKKAGSLFSTAVSFPHLCLFSTFFLIFSSHLILTTCELVYHFLFSVGHSIQDQKRAEKEAAEKAELQASLKEMEDLQAKHSMGSTSSSAPLSSLIQSPPSPDHAASSKSSTSSSSSSSSSSSTPSSFSSYSSAKGAKGSNATAAAASKNTTSTADIIAVIQQNIIGLKERGERLERIHAQSEEMSNNTSQFRDASVRIGQKYGIQPKKTT